MLLHCLALQGHIQSEQCPIYCSIIFLLANIFVNDIISFMTFELICVSDLQIRQI